VLKSSRLAASFRFGRAYFTLIKKRPLTRGSSSFDLAILGGGSAGYAAARTAAAAGLKTVVVEGGPEVGGLCILRGCMPSKALLYAAEVLHLARSGRTWGLRIPKAGFDFKAVMARKKAMIADFAQDRQASLSAGKFQFLRASASFVGPHTVALSDAVGDAPQTVKAKHFIICTGSVISPATPPGLAEIGFLTSDDALSLRALPRSLIVLGGGPVAVELAQFLGRFDVKVTLVQRGQQLLREFDADAAAVVEKVLQREGIRIWTGANMVGAFGRAGRKGVVFEHGGQIQRIAAEEILFALGRVPATAGLDLKNAGVETDFGRIITNAAMQTSAPHIYAAGDCTGPHQIVHIAVEQGEIAAHNIAHPAARRSLDNRLLASVVFTDPQAAIVGLTEKEARARNIPFRAASHPFADHGKSLIMEAKDGFVKLLADPVSGEILGGACVGPLGGELIHEIIAAMHQHMTVRQLALMPHYHPTLAEIWTYPAAELAETVR
jgi:pyruvate/2-oxoglutarate dehydrogenase complex dihydrolipoamide dehydrogenase (E3) component